MKTVERSLSDWEHIAFDNEPAFLDRFCKGATELVGVWWGSSVVKYNFLTRDGETITSCNSMQDWLEFVEEHQ